MGKSESREEDKKDIKERIIDYNPDDLESDESLEGFIIMNGEKKELSKNRDLSPDDFE